MFIRRDEIHSRLKTRPLARAAKRREEAITLENIIFEKGREEWKKATRPDSLKNESWGESHSG